MFMDNAFTEVVSSISMRAATKEFRSLLMVLSGTFRDVWSAYFSLAEVSVNNKYKGLYLLLENIEDEMINRCFKQTGNFLAKPEEIGGNLVYINELDKYINENGDYENLIAISASEKKWVCKNTKYVDFLGDCSVDQNGKKSYKSLKSWLY